MKRINLTKVLKLFSLVLLVVGCGKATPPAPPSPDEMLKGIVTAQPPDTPETLARKKAQLEANLQAAKSASANGDLDAAIAKLEEAMGFDPRHREVLSQLIQISHQRSRQLAQADPAAAYRLMVQAGGYLRTFQELFKDSLTSDEKSLLATILFDEACSHAHSKRYDEFRGTFAAALAAGFKDVQRLESDPDIQSLMSVPELQSLINDAIENLKKE